LAKSLIENMKLTSVDDLFSTEESRQEAKLQKVFILPISEIQDFPNHPYKVRDDSAMMNLAESIRENGVRTPVKVRPLPDGGYEMISGHRRKRACLLAEMDTIPAIVEELSDDAAIIEMVESVRL